MKHIILLLALLSAPQILLASLKKDTSTVEYSVDGLIHKGYVRAPNTKGKKPAILIVHEWWGHNDYARSRADQLAAKGYVAMSLDMYGNGKVVDHPKDAGEMAGAVMKNPELMEKKFRAALKKLTERSDVDPKNVAAIGYCFGGAVVLNMAKRGLPLKGVVSVHGSLNTQEPTKKGSIKGKVLVLNGADDTFISAKDIDAFKNDMTQAQVDFEFVNYPKAKHAFSNPMATENGKKFNLPLEYNPEADIASWNKANEFFKTILK